MPWQLAISISIAMYMVTVFIERIYSQKTDVPPSLPPAISYLVGVVPLGIIAGLILPHHVHWNWLPILLIGIVSLSMTLSNWTGFISTKRLPVARYQMIIRFYVVVVVFIGWVILKEGLTKPQIIGAVLLMISALVAVNAPKNMEKQHKRVHWTAVLIALFSATTLGIGLATEKAALEHMQIGAYLIFGYSAQALAMLIFAAKEIPKKRHKSFTRYDFKWSALMGLSNGLCGVFYVIAIVNSNNVSLVTVLTSIELPLLVLLAHALLKEREDTKLLTYGLGLGFLGLLVSSIH